MDTMELSGKIYEHTLSYEVMDCRTNLISETVSTYSSYDDCLDKFHKVLDEAKHAKIDLVVCDGS